MKCFYENSYTEGPEVLLKNRNLAHDYWEKASSWLPKESFRFLEIGGAYGFFCDLVRARTGADTTLLECGEEAANHAESVLGLKVERCFLEDFKTEETFDVIFSGHVVEHLRDVEGYLRMCREKLNPGGVLITLTPNAASWKFKLMGGFWCWASPEHLHFLGPVSARKLHSSAGFTAVEVRSCVPHACHYPGLLVGVVSRLKNLIKYGKNKAGAGQEQGISPRKMGKNTKNKTVQVLFRFLNGVASLERILWGGWESKYTSADELLVVGKKQTDMGDKSS